ncbi:hypothetical protein [uncultured Demequina sp.]|uniref:hypothetical protein n=1 Tax=uncultured Demequina sp. TaxID=693499 RepID=UPI0025E40971|nr:hypothetical protein [uncultured Demequina sp.]
MARGFNYAPGASDDVELASRAELSRAQIQSLAGGKNPVVRERIAGRGDLPLGTMVGLAHDRSAEVRAAIAGNPRATEPILERLADDRNVAVLQAVIGNPVVPSAIVEKLAFHRKDEVRSVAVRRLDSIADAVPASVDHTPELSERARMADVVELRQSQVSLHEPAPERPTRTAPVRGFRPPAEG